MGATIPKMPNFIYLGPAGASGSGSLVTLLEMVADYILKCAKKLQSDHIAALEPS